MLIIKLLCIILIIINIIYYFSSIPNSGCQMTYSWPNYKFISHNLLLNEQIQTRYRLFHYQNNNLQHVMNKGKVILFIPGSGGSYKQVRSMASRSVQYQLQLNWFTVDFREQISLFSGHVIEQQRDFLFKCIKVIQEFYQHANHTFQIILISHSMGGIVVRSLLSIYHKELNHFVNGIIALGSPFLEFPLYLDQKMYDIYSAIHLNKKYNNNVTIISIAGGIRDILLESYLIQINRHPLEHIPTHINILTRSIPTVATGCDHLSLVWCSSVMDIIATSINHINHSNAYKLFSIYYNPLVRHYHRLSLDNNNNSNQIIVHYRSKFSNYINITADLKSFESIIIYSSAPIVDVLACNKQGVCNQDLTSQFMSASIRPYHQKINNIFDMGIAIYSKHHANNRMQKDAKEFIHGLDVKTPRKPQWLWALSCDFNHLSNLSSSSVFSGAKYRIEKGCWQTNLMNIQKYYEYVLHIDVKSNCTASPLVWMSIISASSQTIHEDVWLNEDTNNIVIARNPLDRQVKLIIITSCPVKIVIKNLWWQSMCKMVFHDIIYIPKYILIILYTLNICLIFKWSKKYIYGVLIMLIVYNPATEYLKNGFLYSTTVWFLTIAAIVEILIWFTSYLLHLLYAIIPSRNAILNVSSSFLYITLIIVYLFINSSCFVIIFPLIFLTSITHSESKNNEVIAVSFIVFNIISVFTLFPNITNILTSGNIAADSVFLLVKQLVEFKSNQQHFYENEYLRLLMFGFVLDYVSKYHSRMIIRSIFGCINLVLVAWLCLIPSQMVFIHLVKQLNILICSCLIVIISFEYLQRFQKFKIN